MNYHDNGEKEYEGYWCDNNRFGKGEVYDRYGKLVKECVWYNGNEIDIEANYEGDGGKPINTKVTRLHLLGNSILRKFKISVYLIQVKISIHILE